MDDHPHIAYLFSEYPSAPPALCDTEMQALEATGFRLTVASLAVPDNCFRLQRPASLKAEVLYPPPRALSDMLRLSAPQDESWQAMAHLAARHATRHSESLIPRGLERSAWLFARELRRRGVQHVHVRSFAALPAALYLKKAGFPFSFVFDVLPAVDPAFHELLSELMHEAEFVIAGGEVIRDSLASIVPDTKDKIHCIHQGIDASRYRAALCGEAGTLRLITIAPFRHDSDPGLSLVFEALTKLHDAGVHTELVIACYSQGTTAHVLNNMPAPASGVRFCHAGEHEEMKRLLAASDVYLHLDTSASVPAPPGIMEAMATGLPVVALARPGLTELIEDGVNGWLIPPGPEALVERLSILANDPALRAAAGHAGLERMQEAFSLERTARPLAAQFRKSIAGRFAPFVAPGAAGVLCLLENWPCDSTDILLAEELRFLRGQAGVEFLVARADSRETVSIPPEGMEFLPDGSVLEAVWRQENELACKAAALRASCPHTSGEDFFLAARRAVYLATLRRSRGWAHVHALRAATALWAWLLHRITGLSASVTVEPALDRRPQPLTDIIDGFSFGSLSDPRIPADLPDLLHPVEPKDHRRFFGLLPHRKNGTDPAAVWTRWLIQARGAAARVDG